MVEYVADATFIEEIRAVDAPNVLVIMELPVTLSTLILTAFVVETVMVEPAVI
jgi:hypothetical protein